MMAIVRRLYTQESLDVNVQNKLNLSHISGKNMYKYVRAPHAPKIVVRKKKKMSHSFRLFSKELYSTLHNTKCTRIGIIYTFS